MKLTKEEQKRLETYWEMNRKLKRANFLYVIQCVNDSDVSRVYEIFSNIKNCNTAICENKTGLSVRVETKDAVDDLNDLIGSFDIKRIIKYQFVDTWEEFPNHPMNEEEGKYLFSRLSQLKKHNKKVDKIMITAGLFTTIVIGSIAALTKINILYGVAALFIILFFALRGVYFSSEKECKEAWSKMKQNWVIYDCDIVCPNVLVHRGNNSVSEEVDFYLANGCNVVRHNFTGLSLDVGSTAKIYMIEGSEAAPTKDEFFEDTGEQIYFLNDKYLIIPENYIIPERFEKIFNKYYAKEHGLPVEDEKDLEKQKKAEEKQKKKEERLKLKEEKRKAKENKKKKANNDTTSLDTSTNENIVEGTAEIASTINTVDKINSEVNSSITENVENKIVESVEQLINGLDDINEEEFVSKIKFSDDINEKESDSDETENTNNSETDTESSLEAIEEKETENNIPQEEEKAETNLETSSKLDEEKIDNLLEEENKVKDEENSHEENVPDLEDFSLDDIPKGINIIDDNIENSESNDILDEIEKEVEEEKDIDTSFVINNKKDNLEDLPEVSELPTLKPEDSNLSYSEDLSEKEMSEEQKNVIKLNSDFSLDDKYSLDFIDDTVNLEPTFNKQLKEVIDSISDEIEETDNKNVANDVDEITELANKTVIQEENDVEIEENKSSLWNKLFGKKESDAVDVKDENKEDIEKDETEEKSLEVEPVADDEYVGDTIMVDKKELDLEYSEEENVVSDDETLILNKDEIIEKPIVSEHKEKKKKKKSKLDLIKAKFKKGEN